MNSDIDLYLAYEINDAIDGYVRGEPLGNKLTCSEYALIAILWFDEGGKYEH